MTTEEIKRLAELMEKFTANVSGNWLESCQRVRAAIALEINSRE